MRDPEKDLEVCLAATPGPWIIHPELCGPGGQSVYQEAGFGPICDVSDPYPRGDNRPQQNMEFIAMARTALPYWIGRAKQAEKDHAALKEVLEIMRSIAAAEDDEKMRTLRGLARQTVDMYDRGKLGLRERRRTSATD